MHLPLFSRQLWLPGSTRRTFRFEGGLREWILAARWSPNSGITKKKVSLSPHGLEELADASVNDALRLSIASFESAAVSHRPADPRSCAWQFIAYYYAGYFAANALMRLCGYACTNLSALECAEINQQALLYGVGGTSEANKLAAGLYYSRFDPKGDELVHLSLVGGKGGVHIQFWIAFMRFLQDLKKSIKNDRSLPTVDRNAALAELDELVHGLQREGTDTGAWLSEVRNAVNYRFDYGLWYPYENNGTTNATVKNAISSAINGNAVLPKANQTLSDPERAARLSAFLMAWLRASLLTLETTSRGNKKALISDGSLAMAALV